MGKVNQMAQDEAEKAFEEFCALPENLHLMPDQLLDKYTDMIEHELPTRSYEL